PKPDEGNRIAAEKRQMPDATNADQAGNCSYTVPGGDAGRTAKASEQLFKRKIYDNYNIGVGRSGSAPLKVGVTFLAFQMKPAFTNVVRVVPGGGAQR